MKYESHISYDPNKTLFGYIRVSSEDSASKGLSPEDQRNSVEQKSIQLGLSHVYLEDLGISAFCDDNIENRDSYRELLQLLKTGKVKFVYAKYQNRLWRNPIEQESTLKVLKQAKAILYTSDCLIDGSTGKIAPETEMVTSIKTAVDFCEVKKIAERTKAGRRVHAKQGKYLGGNSLNFGWTFVRKNIYEPTKDDSNLVHEPEEKKIFFQIVEWFLGGMGCKAIAKRLNDTGVKTKGQRMMKEKTEGINRQNKETKKWILNKKENFSWASSTIQRMLKNPIYKGKRKFNPKDMETGEFLYDNKNAYVEVEPMISEEVWDEIQKRISTNKAMSKRNNKSHFYLLRGLIRCEYCEKNYNGETRKKYQRGERTYIQSRYLCSCTSRKIANKCLNEPIRMSHLDKLVWDVVSNSDFFIQKIVADLYATDTASQIGNLESEIKVLQKEDENQKKRRKKTIELYEAEGITMEEFKEKGIEYKSEQLKLEHKCNILNGQITALKDVRQHCERLIDFVHNISEKASKYTNDEKRSIIMKIVRHIFVRWEEKQQHHEISIKFDLERVITEKKLTINSDGKYQFDAQKFNLAQFNAKFNPEPHVLCEKYVVPDMVLGNLIVEQQLKP